MSLIRIPFICLCFLTHAAQAGVTSFEIVEVEQNAVPGHTTYDILVNATGRFTGVDMLAQLESGAFYNDIFGSVTPPSPALMPAFPSLAFDTFVGMGGRTSSTTMPFRIPQNMLPIEPPPPPPLTFNDQTLDLWWAPYEDPGVFDPVDFFIARLTISDGARGEIRLRELPPFFGGPSYEQAIPIPIVITEPVPEPSTFALASLGLLASALLFRRPAVKL